VTNNSAALSLIIIGAWFAYFYLANLAGTWTGPFVFDSSELPIITIYLMYLPIFIQWMRKEKSENALRRFVLPTLAFIGSVFMVIACIIGHGIGCLWYLIVFALVMLLGAFLNRHRS
jgi:APA family basic amino acid/polyamine antiporter